MLSPKPLHANRWDPDSAYGQTNLTGELSNKLCGGHNPRIVENSTYKWGPDHEFTAHMGFNNPHGGSMVASVVCLDNGVSLDLANARKKPLRRANRDIGRDDYEADYPNHMFFL
jgi:hypothetical protein